MKRQRGRGKRAMQKDTVSGSEVRKGVTCAQKCSFPKPNGCSRLTILRESGRGGSADDGQRRWHRNHQVSSTSFTSSTSHLLSPPMPPMLLAQDARHVCIPYTPAFQGIDARVVPPLSAPEKLAMRDAVSVLVRLGVRIVGTEVGGLGVRGEMWNLSYAGF